MCPSNCSIRVRRQSSFVRLRTGVSAYGIQCSLRWMRALNVSAVLPTHPGCDTERGWARSYTVEEAGNDSWSTTLLCSHCLHIIMIDSSKSSTVPTTFLKLIRIVSTRCPLIFIRLCDVQMLMQMSMYCPTHPHPGTIWAKIGIWLILVCQTSQCGDGLLSQPPTCCPYIAPLCMGYLAILLYSYYCTI